MLLKLFRPPFYVTYRLLRMFHQRSRAFSSGQLSPHSSMVDHAVLSVLLFSVRGMITLCERSS